MTEMEYRALGNSGLMVSAVGIGCNAFSTRVDAHGVEGILDAAAEVGITLLDTADVYGQPKGQSEELLGQALTGRRDDFVLATKGGMDMAGSNGADHGAVHGAVHGACASRRYLRRALEASLRRLRTDHVDVYQIHRPDPHTPIEETLSVLTDFVHEGKVCYVGCSNFAAWQITDAAWTARTHHLVSFVSAQNQYSLLTRGIEDDIIPAAARFGLGILPFFPLEAGLLTGKYRQGQKPPAGTRFAVERGRREWLQEVDWNRVRALEAFATSRGVELLDVAIGGLAAQPGVSSVIAGVTSADQVRRNARALQWRPTAADLDELNHLTR